MTWLELFLHAHPQLFGYALLVAMLVFLFTFAGVVVAENARAERWRDWHANQRPRRS